MKHVKHYEEIAWKENVEHKKKMNKQFAQPFLKILYVIFEAKIHMILITTSAHVPCVSPFILCTSAC